MSGNEGAERRFPGFFDAVPLGLYRSTPDGRIIDVNDAFLSILRAPNRSALLELNARDLYVDQEDRHRWRERIAREGVIRRFVTKLRRMDGEVISVELTATAVRDKWGKVRHYAGAVDDITKRLEAEQALAATEALLQASVEQTPAGVIIADAPDVNIRVANRAALGIRGETGAPLTEIPAEIHPERWQVFFPDGSPCAPEDLPLTRAVRKGEVVRDAELIIRRDTGEDRWVLANAAPVRDGNGEIVAGVVVFPDITERKRTEAALSRREAILEAVGFAASCFLTAPSWEDNIQEVLVRLGDAVEVSRVYLFEAHTSEDGTSLISQRFEWVAEGVESILDDPSMQGLDLAAVGMERWLDLFGENEVVAGDMRKFPESEQWLIEAQDIQSILLVPVFVGGTWWGVMGFDACVAERDWSTAEVEALRTAASTLAAAIQRRTAESERIRLEKAVEQVADSIVITDADGTIQYVNPAFEVITGYPMDKAVGQNPSVLKSGVHDRAFYENLWRTISRGDVWRGHIVNRRKDGNLFEEEATISPVRNEAGEIVNYVGVKRDVTEQAFLERELRQAQKMESLGHLAGGIAHDFNNVMGQILGAAELLKRKIDEEQLSGYVDLILDAVGRGKNITGRMLAFTRSAENDLRAVSARDLLRNLAQVGKHTFPKEIRIRLSAPPEDLYARCDAAEVQQALMNLCINAVDAMPGGGELSLGFRAAAAAEVALHASEPAGEYVCFTVSDTGSGMDPETLESIFEPFYTKKPVGKGTGLGLYIVYGIAKAQNGWVAVDSAPGRGTSVTVGLPAGEKPTESGRVPESPSVRNGGDGRQVLVVDDELGLLILLTEILEGEDYRVSCAPDGEKALQLIEERGANFDLVITDLGMPNMGGRELVERLRKIRPELPIVVASGYLDTEEMAALQQLGVQAVLTKPFEVDEVVQTVAEALEA